MFDPIIVDKNVDLNTQQRDLAEPQLELPLPETRSTQDNWAQEQMDLHQNAPDLPDTSSLYHHIEQYMAQAAKAPTMIVGANAVASGKKVAKLPLPTTAAPKAAAGPAAAPVAPPSSPASKPMDAEKSDADVEAETIPITIGTSEPVSRLAPPKMPSIGNVAIEKIGGRSSRNLNDSADISAHVSSGNGTRLDIPDTRQTKREVRTSHSTDDPYGTLYSGQKVLDEVGAYSHLSDEMLSSMQDNQRLERDFRASQIQLFRKAAADLSEDNRRIISIESAFECGREVLGDVNI